MQAKSKKIFIAILILVLIAVVAVCVCIFVFPKTSYEVQIQNLSQEYSLSQGIVVIHNKNVSLQHNATLSPKEFEIFAETGEVEGIKEYLEDLSGVKEVYLFPSLAPSKNTSINVQARAGTYLSFIQQVRASNDGYILLDSLPLTNSDNGENSLLTFNSLLPVFDNGTEYNTNLGSGFKGGQYQADKGVENIANGRPTSPQQRVKSHPQLSGRGLGYIRVTEKAE